MDQYFCGWYFKCQSDHQTCAAIPALNESNGIRSCSIQLIADDGAWNIPFPENSFHKSKKNFFVNIGENVFSRYGMKLKLNSDQLNAEGIVRFGPLLPIKYDIMGPFALLPFMECRHSVISMKHSINGRLRINGKEYLFRNGMGYIEGDKGHSFPSEYAWTQCFFNEGSIMLSVAEIPIGKTTFTGIIGIIFFKGKEYRLATYLGAKVIKKENGELVVFQGNSMFTAKLIKKNAMPLNAPSLGIMSRTIRESPSCCASYCYIKDGKTVFSFKSNSASFEYEYKS